MGKIRTRLIGDEEIEEKQKKEQKIRSQEKKLEKKSASAKASADKKEKISDVKKETQTKSESKKEDPGQAGMTSSGKKKEKKQKIVKVKPRGKLYKKALELVDKNKLYEVQEAVELLKKIAFAKFEESIELHLNLLSEGLKGEVELPHTTGKTVRVAIMSDAIIEKLEKGVIDFDILISHPSFMPKIAKFARTLGPKGLMPNPKTGTLTTNPEETAKKFEKGTLRWKSESKFPLIHQLVAKLPHETKAIAENTVAFINAVGKKNIKAAFLKSTMSPSLKLDLENI